MSDEPHLVVAAELLLTKLFTDTTGGRALSGDELYDYLEAHTTQDLPGQAWIKVAFMAIDLAQTDFTKRIVSEPVQQINLTRVVHRLVSFGQFLVDAL
jgi:hypothetical protein